MTIAVLVGAALAYALGMRRAARRGTSWPAHRAVLFYALGLGSYAVIELGFLGTWSAELRWAFVARIALLLMAVPALIALGRPLDLARAGLSVTVLESHHGHDPRFRGELIHPRGVRALRSLGLESALLQGGAVPVQGFAVTPGPGLRTALLPYLERWGQGLGVDHQRMVASLREAVRSRPGITLRQGEPVVDVLRDGTRVTGVRLRNGETLHAGLVIGADGRQSKVRAALGLEADVKLLSYSVIASVQGALLPWQGFGHVFLGAPGPVLAYPYGDGLVRLCIDVPLEAPRGRGPMLKWVEQHYAAAMPQPLRDAVLSSLAAHPLEACATHSVHTRDCVTPGAALVGDAGGCSHPLTATGMTAAMNDVMELAQALTTYGPGDRALEVYQQRRYRFVRAREVFTEALYDVFRATDAGSEALKAGTFEYWRRSSAARARSMGILSGEDSRRRTFVTEYAKVTGRSALRTWKQPARTRALLTTSFLRIRHTAVRTAVSWARERRAPRRGPA